MNKDQNFFVGQKAFIRKGNEVLFLKNSNKGIHFPGGKIQETENDLGESLKREVREETSLEVNVGDPFASLMVNLSDPSRKLFLIVYKCEYVSGEIKLSNEHDNFVWLNKDNYMDYDDGSVYFDVLKKYFSSY